MKHSNKRTIELTERTDSYKKQVQLSEYILPIQSLSSLVIIPDSTILKDLEEPEIDVTGDDDKEVLAPMGFYRENFVDTNYEKALYKVEPYQNTKQLKLPFYSHYDLNYPYLPTMCLVPTQTPTSAEAVLSSPFSDFNSFGNNTSSAVPCSPCLQSPSTLLDKTTEPLAAPLVKKIRKPKVTSKKVSKHVLQVSTEDYFNSTDLAIVAMSNRSLDVAKPSIEANLSLINAINSYGEAALHIATVSGATRTIECLLANGADPSVKNLQGNNALHIAASNFKVGLVEKFSTQFPELIMEMNNDKKTPLDLAKESPYLNSYGFKERIIMKLDEASKKLESSHSSAPSKAIEREKSFVEIIKSSRERREQQSLHSSL